MARLLGLLPVLVACAAVGKAADDWRLAFALAVVASVVAAVGPRWDVDRGRRLLTAAMGAGAGYVLVSMVHDPQRGALGEGWTRFAAAAVLAASARFLLVGVELRRVSNALLFVAVMAAGESHVRGYAPLVAAFLLTSLWVPVAHEEGALLSSGLTRRVVGGGAVLLLSAAMSVGALVGVHRAYMWLSQRQHVLALSWTPRVGFSDRIDLGALDGMLDSDTIVLRVMGGARVDYLRGAVLDSYVRGQWTRSDGKDGLEVTSRETFGGPPEEPGEVKIEAVAEHTDRVFLPLEARGIATSPPAVLVDRAGAVKRAGPAPATPVVARFFTGERDRAPDSPPTYYDLQVPRVLRPRLTRLVIDWVRDAQTPEEALRIIAHKLRSEFTYAQAFPRVNGPDPVFDFLFFSKNGHCEYFASAMAMLARTAGIPTRYVAGYRVGEQSPFGYYVVRERNAHSWVEAWVEGKGWTTFDPTPDAELPQNRDHRASYFAALSDGLKVKYAALEDWLARRTLRQTAMAWAAGFAVLIWIVARGVRRRGPPVRGLREDEAALPCLKLLLATLERQGVALDDHEPIERLAERVPDEDAARLLARYAALRYGGLGDLTSLDRDVARYTREVDGRGP
jgi:transglutaminase-like putative cysteine protease